MRYLLLALALIFTLPATTFADVDCGDVKSKNRDECVRGKRNNNGNNNDRGNNINCSDVKNKNRDECAEAKFNRNNNDFDKDDIDCSNADDPQVRRQCRQRKRD